MTRPGPNYKPTFRFRSFSLLFLQFDVGGTFVVGGRRRWCHYTPVIATLWTRLDADWATRRLNVQRRVVRRQRYLTTHIPLVSVLDPHWLWVSGPRWRDVAAHRWTAVMTWWQWRRVDPRVLRQSGRVCGWVSGRVSGRVSGWVSGCCPPRCSTDAAWRQCVWDAVRSCDALDALGRLVTHWTPRGVARTSNSLSRW